MNANVPWFAVAYSPTWKAGGPGSGVRASSVSVATLLMSVLVTDKLTDSEERVRALAEACPLSGKCAFTGMPRFLRAFALLLTAKSKAALVSSITISRTADIATISYFDQNHELKQSSFYGKESNEHGIIVNSIFPGKMLHHISEDVLAIWREITTEKSDV